MATDKLAVNKNLHKSFLYHLLKFPMATPVFRAIRSPGTDFSQASPITIWLAGNTIGFLTLVPWLVPNFVENSPLKIQFAAYFGDPVRSQFFIIFPTEIPI